MNKVYLPMLKAFKDWGHLSQSSDCQKIKGGLVDNCERFMHSLTSEWVVGWGKFSFCNPVAVVSVVLCV